MKKLIAGKSGPLKAAPAKAVRSLMESRMVNDGTVERPDVASQGMPLAKVRVKVHAPRTKTRLPLR